MLNITDCILFTYVFPLSFHCTSVVTNLPYGIDVPELVLNVDPFALLRSASTLNLLTNLPSYVSSVVEDFHALDDALNSRPYHVSLLKLAMLFVQF